MSTCTESQGWQGPKGGERGVPCSVAYWSDLPLLPNPVSCLRCTPHSHPHKVVPGPDHVPPSPLCLDAPTPSPDISPPSGLSQALFPCCLQAAGGDLPVSPPQSELRWHSRVSLRVREPGGQGHTRFTAGTALCPDQQRLPKCPLGTQTNGHHSLPPAWPPRQLGVRVTSNPARRSYI